jgi:hypothetical protein
MTRADKRERIRQLLKEDPTRSNREIGQIAGVDHVTDGAVRRDLEVDGEIHQPSTSGEFHQHETHHETHQE